MSFALTITATAADITPLETSAESGDAQAQYERGNKYGYNSSEGFDWHQKAANQGHREAQTVIGSRYNSGDVVARDGFKALEWFTKAAEQGEAKAQYRLAYLYNNGKSVRKNTSKAKEWYGKACDNGNQEGCNEYKKLNK